MLRDLLERTRVDFLRETYSSDAFVPSDCRSRLFRLDVTQVAPQWTANSVNVEDCGGESTGPAGMVLSTLTICCERIQLRYAGIILQHHMEMSHDRSNPM